MPQLSILFSRFFNSERAGGLLLICCTILSLTLTNLLPAYHDLWQTAIGSHSLTEWINDALMAIFFLMIGLELEREVYIGELSSLRNASLPVIAAVGGMLVPAAIYVVVNSHGLTNGFGIPMATDIAFAIGVLSLLGDRIPATLKIFLTALAVIDDLGAILVIAVFYSSEIQWLYLALAGMVMLVLFVLNRMKIEKLSLYLVLGVFLWYFMWHSGVHSTIAGVLLAFAIPFGKGDEASISYRLQDFLHKPVAFLILPVFALANTSLFLNADFYSSLTSAVSLGIILGLIIGKPAGIFLFSFFSVRLKLSALPADLRWRDIFGASLLGGIGFTMSIFITFLAFDDETLIANSKMAIMVASVIAGIFGLLFLKRTLNVRSSQEPERS